MKLTDFQGWQTDMEYLTDEAECKRRTEWAIAMYRKHQKALAGQARRQRLSRINAWIGEQPWWFLIIGGAGLGFIAAAALLWVLGQ